MNIVKKTKNIFKKALTSNMSPNKLALSVTLGIYIAFSPFPGAHTIMMLLFKWLFRLNLPILFFVSSFNNPWTMIPFFTLDYIFGYWFMHDFLHITPSLVIPLAKVFGSGKICLWSFLIGGNILGIVAALICYPIASFIFKKFSIKLQMVK